MDSDSGDEPTSTRFTPHRARRVRVTRHQNERPYTDPYAALEPYTVAHSEHSSDPRYAHSSIQETPTNLHSLRDYPKSSDDDMSKPVLFYGKPNQLEDVLTFAAIKNIVDGNQTDQSQCGLLASLFRGQALHWLTAQMQADPELLDSYDDFKAKLCLDFGLSDSARRANAAQRLATTTQRGPVQLYAIEMRQLFQVLDIKDEQAITHFSRGLKLHIREALVSSGQYTKLDQLISEAARIDTELYNARRPSGGGRGRQQRQGSSQGIKCHTCGKFGHKARECRSTKTETY